MVFSNEQIIVNLFLKTVFGKRKEADTSKSLGIDLWQGVWSSLHVTMSWKEWEEAGGKRVMLFCSSAVEQPEYPQPFHLYFGMANLSVQLEAVTCPMGKVVCYFPTSAPAFRAYCFTDFNRGIKFSILRIWAAIF